MENSQRIFLRKGRFVYIKQPEFREMGYIKDLWADKDTMRDVGGTIDFGEERWKGWYERMVNPSDGHNFYCLIYNYDDLPVGEVSFHGYDEKSRSAELNIKIHSKHRGRGYSKEALSLLLEYYFFEFGGMIMTDEVINENGCQALTKYGFDIASRTSCSTNFVLTRDNFEGLYIKNIQGGE